MDPQSSHTAKPATLEELNLKPAYSGNGNSIVLAVGGLHSQAQQAALLHWAQQRYPKHTTELLDSVLIIHEAPGETLDLEAFKSSLNKDIQRIADHPESIKMPSSAPQAWSLKRHPKRVFTPRHPRGIAWRIE